MRNSICARTITIIRRDADNEYDEKMRTQDKSAQVGTLCFLHSVSTFVPISISVYPCRGMGKDVAIRH